MIKVLKPGTGSHPLTAFSARHNHIEKLSRQQSTLPIGIIALAVWLLPSLACVVPALDPSVPIYTPPVAQIYITETPEITPVEPSPTAEVALISTEDTPTPSPTKTYAPPKMYYSQAGDTLNAVATRFGVSPDEITISPATDIADNVLLPPNLLLVIPNHLSNTTSPIHILPDSEIVYAPSTIGFDVNAFVSQTDGFLSTYREYLGSTGWTSGADVIQRISIENSINPRLLLALLEYESGWVYGDPVDLLHTDYPMGYVSQQREGLYAQLSWAINQLAIGYYGWREGRLTEITFSDGVKARLAPELNAGSVALQYYLAQTYDSAGWLEALDVNNGLPALHERMFGNPWLRAQAVEPLFPPELQQPPLTLPFIYNQLWAFTGGPHGAWERDGARAALDFSPGRTESGCVESNAWVIAVAPGLIVRVANGLVVTDLDGDGHEQTGWVIIYLHVKDGKYKVGDLVNAGDGLGHPSCEGGIATGTHLHIARKYNGEWIPAYGPVPFVMDGWVPEAGDRPYKGTLTRGDEVITASEVGSCESRIIRRHDDEP